ncbi:MAG: MBL fold metallo-hydrolase [Chromatiales bacterium]|nr:MBL fold metallo-hydrolase [Chromatiales bacterium]
MTALISCANWQTVRSFEASKQFKDGYFQNESPITLTDFKKMVGILSRTLFEESGETVPTTSIPLVQLTNQQLLDQQPLGPAVYRLGHSSLLLSLSGEFWLIDPVFSQRASPVQWAGPKRFHPTPITLDQLPEISGVIISHDHYDHLDRETITQLRDQVEHFVMPLGVGTHLQKWGVEDSRIHELDWWEEITLGSVRLTATPAQHFSGRGIRDRNRTLWSSWVIRTPETSLFFSGDSGYFAGFKEIGKRFGPFDLTMIESGAYDRDWPDVHMTPEQTLQAHLDLKGRALLPIHNGTFNLAFHAWSEPLEQLAELSEEQGVRLLTPIMGQRVSMTEPPIYSAWWRDPLGHTANRLATNPSITRSNRAPTPK